MAPIYNMINSDQLYKTQTCDTGGLRAPTIEVPFREQAWFCGHFDKKEGAWLHLRKRRVTTAGLRQKFGPEYDGTVLVHGSERKAEAKLADRDKRVENLSIRDLDPVEHNCYSKQWQAVQSRFVDLPKGAVAEADDLVSFCNEGSWLASSRFRLACRRHFC